MRRVRSTYRERFPRPDSYRGRSSAGERSVDGRRLRIMLGISWFLGVAIILRLLVLQIFNYDYYAALAAGTHSIYRDLFPERGSIMVRDRLGRETPVAANRELFLVYADPRKVTNPNGAAAHLARVLGVDEMALLARLDRPDDPYEPLAHGVSKETLAEIKKLSLAGIDAAPEQLRTYPEKDFGGHVLGFVGSDAEGRKGGRYGLEGFWQKELAGEAGSLRSERDAHGRLISVGTVEIATAKDGADLLLTVDRTVQFVACAKLRAAVARHGADGGTVVIAEPATGAIIAICSAPDYDPNSYAEVDDLQVYNNPAISYQYEPGSIFKSITMSIALEEGKVKPETTYTDTGEVRIPPDTIRNSDGKAYGVQTMTQVLDQSLNTGAVYAMRTVGARTFRKYVESFGFGEATGVELGNEVRGDTAALRKSGEIYAVTASFGQGIAVTPLQLVAAYGALANGGKLMKPYIVAEVRRSDGTKEVTSPRVLREVISPRTSKFIAGMLTSVVERGHGKRAGVPGYYVAGKTGTAQVPKPGGGYDPDVTIGSFAGFAPADDPKFVMLVKIDRPRDVIWAESTAAPLFGELAAFLLQYYEVPPER
ncbi:MAG: penicillin-binding protein 2 [Patescibacteria group bacterium]